MKITAIAVYQLTLPLKQVYRLSGGRLKFEQLDSTFVRVDTDCAISGWGESCPWGHTYLPAHGAGVRAGLDVLAPALMGRDPRSLEAINRFMDLTLPGHPAVKSAVDIACWDILGQSAGLPLWQLLGGAGPAAVAVNSSIPTGTPDEMVAAIKRASATGCRTHSAKVGGADTGLDIARIAAIAAAVAVDEKVTFDVNRAWTPGVAVQVLGAVKTHHWVEQPCETLDQCAQVAARVGNPIMLDECLHTFQDCLDAWARHACAGAKVKPNRVGGLTRARQIRDFGVAVGWQMHIEDVGGSALADTAAIHLASATPAANRLASWLCHDHLAVDPTPHQGARNRSGWATPPDAPGLGVAPELELLGDAVAVYS